MANSKQMIELVPPFRWMGERGCVVGPFKTRMVADFFVEYVMLHNDDSASADYLFEDNGRWFIDARWYSEAVTAPGNPAPQSKRFGV